MLIYKPMEQKEKLIYKAPTLNVLEAVMQDFLCQSGGDIEGIEIEDWTLE